MVSSKITDLLQKKVCHSAFRKAWAFEYYSRSKSIYSI